MSALSNHFGNDAAVDWRAVRTIIEGEENAIRYVDKDGRTPIHHAVMKAEMDNDELMELVVFLYNKWPESLLEQTKVGSTPLHEACHFGKSVEIIQFLLDKCPEAVRMKGYRGSYPLHDLTYNEVVTEPLVPANALLDAWPESVDEGLDEDDWLPMHSVACGFADLSLVELLATKSATSLTKRDIFGCLPIHHATRCHSDLPKIKCLVKHFPGSLAELDEVGRTPLHHACHEDKPDEMLEYLVKEYPLALTVKDSVDGWTPLHRACYYNLDLRIVKFLVAKAPQATAWKGIEGQTPLEILTGNGPTHGVTKSKDPAVVQWFNENAVRIEASIIYGDLVSNIWGRVADAAAADDDVMAEDPNE